ncbi:MAG: hypothetical protein PV344_04135 [Anaplasma sp.]|nr:hypothetical protein [Anaplasma sp.]
MSGIQDKLTSTKYTGYSNHCKRLNFREDLIFANRLRFAKSRCCGQFGPYVNTMEATFDSRKLEKTANNFKFSALARFAKI